MDTTEWLQAWPTALMEAALGDSSPMDKYRLELTITPIPAWQYTPSTMRYSKQAYYTREELLFTLQSLRVSSVQTSSNMQE